MRGSNNPHFGRARDIAETVGEWRVRYESDSLNGILDERFPWAKSKQVIEYDGKKYQRRFSPLARSRSGKSVVEWGREWRLVG